MEKLIKEITIDGMKLKIDMNEVFIPYFENGHKDGGINNLGVQQLAKELLCPLDESLKECLVSCAGNSTSYTDLSIKEAIEQRCSGIEIVS